MITVSRNGVSISSDRLTRLHRWLIGTLPQEEITAMLDDEDDDGGEDFLDDDGTDELFAAYGIPLPPAASLGEIRKMQGINLIAARNALWMLRAITILRARLPWSVDIQPDLYRQLVAPLIGEPTRFYAWGALGRRLRELRIVQGTGVIRKSEATRNNAHRYELVRRVS